MTLPDSNPDKRPLSELPEVVAAADALGASPSGNSDSGGSLRNPNPSYRAWAWTFLTTTVLVAIALVVEVLR